MSLNPAANQKIQHSCLFSSKNAPNTLFLEVPRSFISKNIDQRPVYVNIEIPLNYSQGYQMVPSGLTFRLFRGIPSAPIPPQKFDFRPLPRTNAYVENIRNSYSIAYVNQAAYGLTLGDTETSSSLLRFALALEPNSPEAWEVMRRIGRTAR